MTRGNWLFNECSQSRSFSSLTCIMAKNSSRRFQMKPNQSITWVGIQTDLLLLATNPSSAKWERIASAAKRAVLKSCSQSAPPSKCKSDMKYWALQCLCSVTGPHYLCFCCGRGHAREASPSLRKDFFLNSRRSLRPRSYFRKVNRNQQNSR